MNKGKKIKEMGDEKMKSIKWMLFGMTLLLVTFFILFMLDGALYTDFIGIFGAIIVLYGMCKNEKQ